MIFRLSTFPALSWGCHFLKMKTVTEKINNKCFWAACVLPGWVREGTRLLSLPQIQEASLAPILENLKARLWTKFWDPNHFTFLQITQHMVNNICAEICMYLVQVDLCPYKLLLKWFELLCDWDFFFPKLQAWPPVVSRQYSPSFNVAASLRRREKGGRNFQEIPKNATLSVDKDGPCALQS